MRKNKAILDLKNEKIAYKQGRSFSASLVSAYHSSVHFHESDIELVYCLRGKVNILCNHEQVTLSRGQVFTINYRDIHCVFSDSDNCLIIFHIDMNNTYLPKDYLEYVYFGCQDSSCMEKQRDSLVKVKQMLLAATLALFRDSDKDMRHVENAANEIIKLLCADFDYYNSLHNEKITSHELHERMHNIIKYCQKNYSRKITMNTLAKEIHINGNYFSQFMRSSIYGSFSNMMGYIRSYEAQYLLLTSEHSILTISHMCGFSNDKYFYKQFKQWWGKTPQEYRDWFKAYVREPIRMFHYEEEECLRQLFPYITEYFIDAAFNSE